MRAFMMDGFGTVDKGVAGTLPMPTCRPGDLLVRVAAAGVNPTDWKEMAGYLVPFYPPYEPQWAPGFDGAGIVEEIGAEVTGFKPGDRVVLFSDRRGGQNGTFAEFVRVDQTLAAPAPASISLIETASIPVAGITSYEALFRDDMGAGKAGQSLVIHGGSGGVGSFLAAFAAAAGIRTAATCRPVNDSYLHRLGVERTIDYRTGNIVGDALQWQTGGVDIFIDAVAGGKDLTFLDCLAPGGRLVIVATVSDDGDIPALQAEAARRGLSAHYLLMDHTNVTAELTAISKLIDGGKMPIPEIIRYPLERAGDAVQALKKGGVRGKLVVEIADLG